jgi:hypothetical protein
MQTDLLVVIVVVVNEVVEVEHVPDRCQGGRDIGIEPVRSRIRQVVAAAALALAESSVALRELHENERSVEMWVMRPPLDNGDTEIIGSAGRRRRSRPAG